jgi:Protein of unknown function (DUF4038)/Putative collagen-binding domain of a collagenase
MRKLVPAIAVVCSLLLLGSASFAAPRGKASSPQSQTKGHHHRASKREASLTSSRSRLRNGRRAAAATRVASFTFFPSSPTAGQAVTFQSTGGCKPKPCTYAWDDDGPDGPGGTNSPLGNGKTLVFTFTTPGTKYVRLTVTDGRGRRATVEHDVVVTAASSTPPPPPPAKVPPSNTSLPAITGTAQVGSTLMASPGVWTGDTPISFSYQWSDGTTGQADTLSSGDQGKSITVTVTASNDAGTATARSNSVGPVAAAPPPAVKVPPSNTSLPTISGTAQVGSTLTASPGVWSGDTPIAVTYQWSDGTTGQTDALPSSDQGKNISVTVTATNDGGSASAKSNSVGPVAAAPSPPPPNSTFPLKLSASSRYLVTQSGSPFLMVGDTPWSLIGALSEASASQYYADRAAHGFNTALSALLCDNYTGCNANGTTFDGIAPFTSGNGPGSYDLSTPNTAYFQRAHDDIAQAEADGIEVLLDPIETGGWLTTLENNGPTKDKAYGQFIGNFFKDLPNIIWISGNDFQSYTNSTDNADALAVAQGIQAADPTALQTSELNFCANGGNTCIGSTSLDDASWTSVLGLNGAYTYSPTYADVLKAYNATPTLPVFMEEANYEQEQNNATDGGSLQNLRLQEWWTMTSGAMGQLYGCHCTWATLANGFSNSSIDTSGVAQLQNQTKLLNTLDWEDLAPDASHKLVTAGFGTFSSTGSIDSNNYVTAAETPDGKLALAYLPKGGMISVAMGQMAGSTSARWYDPTNGTFTSIAGSPFTNSGSQTFTPPSTNSGGGTDWVLVLQASASSPPPATVPPTNTALPAISGTPQQGNTLTASHGTWTGDTPMTFTCSWSDGTTGCSDTLGSTDVGKTVTVSVTATNDGGSASATSKATAVVTAPPAPPPSATSTANLWISPSGGSCTRQTTAGAEIPAQDCSSMNAALQAARCGDTVNFVAGSYPDQALKDNSALDNCSSNVVFEAAQGLNRSQVVIGNDNGSSIDSGDSGAGGASNWTLQNVTVAANINLLPCPYTSNAGACSTVAHNVTINNIQGGSFFAWIPNLTIENSNFGPCYNLVSLPAGSKNNNSTPGPTVSPDPSVHCNQNIKGFGPNTVFENNTVHDFLDDNSDPAFDHFECMFIGGDQNLTIEDSKFYNCQIYSIFIQNAGTGPLLIQNNWFGPGLGGMGACTSNGNCPSPTGGGSNNWNVTDGDNSGSPASTNVLIRYNSFDPAAGFSNQSNASVNSGSTWRFVANIMGQGGCQSQFSYSYNLWQSGGPCGTGDVATTTNPFVLSGQKDSPDDLHLKCGSAAENIVASGSGDSALSTDIDGLSRTWPSDAGASVEKSCGT